MDLKRCVELKRLVRMALDGQTLDLADGTKAQVSLNNGTLAVQADGQTFVLVLDLKIPVQPNYYLMDNVGSSKYTVSDHDGIQTHGDGSPFYGIAIFRNKKKRDAYVKDLKAKGYVERP